MSKLLADAGGLIVDGWEFLVTYEREIRALAVRRCRGRYDMCDDLWDVAVDRVPRMVDELWDPGKGELKGYVFYNLKWYFWKRMNAGFKNATTAIVEEEVDVRDDIGNIATDEQVQFILAHVSEDDAELIKLHVLDGLNFEQMSRRLRLLRHTVRKRYLAAVRRLREALDGEC